MAENSVDLSSLESYVNTTLAATDRVRKVLQVECEEAKLVLRPWIVESVVTRNIDENCCTCASLAEVKVDEEATKIAISIDKALSQTQQLRKKLAMNMTDEKRQNKRINSQKVYSSASTSKNTLQNAEQIKLPCSSSSDSSSIGKKLKVPKNFIAANKSSVRAISRKNAQITKNQEFDKRNQETITRRKTVPSVTELDNLIKRVSLDTMKKEISSSSLSHVSSISICPYHSDNTTKTVTERKLTPIDIVDGLEQFGIPDNLLSTLRVYHSYVTNSAKECANPSDRPSVKKFLNKLKKTNDKRLESIKPNGMITLIEEFPKLYRDLHKENIDSVTLSKMKAKYYELDNLSKKCGIKKYDTSKIKKSEVNAMSYNDSIARGWLSNGIWNWSSLQHFIHFTKVPCIKYTDKIQLLSLFNTSQRLQQMAHQKNLLDILLHKIIPMMKNKLDPTTEEYVEMYKMMFIIAQIMNPKLPVLVKTDE